MRAELPIISFICTILVLIPLPWHWRARNVSTLSVIVWLFLCNITRGINSIIWAGNVIVKYPVWCDITTKFIIGANVGLPAAIVCICRFLAQVASPRYKIPNASDKRRRMIFELFMCVVLPIIVMALHYVVQGHRFDILEDFGCIPTTYVSIPALFIIYLPPLVISLIALVYAGTALRWFIHRRAQFRAVLQSSHSGLSTSRYLRLIALSVTEMMFATAMTLFVLIITLETGGLRPWVSWEFVHEDWMVVGQMAKILVPQYILDRHLLVWYIIPLTSVIFFAFFGFGQEAKAEYIKLFRLIKVRVFRIKSEQTPVLPIIMRNHVSTFGPAVDIPTVIGMEDETTRSEAGKWANAPSVTSIPSRPPTPSQDRGMDVISTSAHL